MLSEQDLVLICTKPLIFFVLVSVKADSIYADLKWTSVEGVHKNIDKVKHIILQLDTNQYLSKLKCFYFAELLKNF